ncbi:hypothetical protein BDV18DRAFT_138175 [Aspergillus unguis]
MPTWKMQKIVRPFYGRPSENNAIWWLVCWLWTMSLLTTQISTTELRFHTQLKPVITDLWKCSWTPELMQHIPTRKDTAVCGFFSRPDIASNHYPE